MKASKARESRMEAGILFQVAGAETTKNKEVSVEVKKTREAGTV